MYTAENWPIAAKMNFGSKAPDGTPLVDAPASAWETHLNAVKAYGYAWIDPIDDWVNVAELSDDRFAAFQRVLADHELQVPAISFGRRSPVHPEHGEAYVAQMHRAIDRGAELGASIVNIGFMSDLKPEQMTAHWFWLADGHVDDPALRPLAIERVRELADHAAQQNMQISLEMYEDTYVGTPEDAVAFVTDCDHPAVGLNPDLGNLVRLHRPMPPFMGMFEQVLPYANYWHIKNYLRDFDPATGAYFSAPAPLESGWIDYRQVIRRALSLGYSGAFQTEHYGGDWLGVGAKNKDYIRDVLRTSTDLIGGGAK